MRYFYFKTWLQFSRFPEAFPLVRIKTCFTSLYGSPSRCIYSCQSLYFILSLEWFSAFLLISSVKWCLPGIYLFIYLFSISLLLGTQNFLQIFLIKFDGQNNDKLLFQYIQEDRTRIFLVHHESLEKAKMSFFFWKIEFV